MKSPLIGLAFFLLTVVPGIAQENTMATAVPGTAQDNTYAILTPVKPSQEIPDKPYKSWSLFLICDPKSLAPSSAEAIESLQAQYFAFGKTTGPDHAAVWLEKTVTDEILEN